MDRLNFKFSIMQKALKTLREAIEDFETIKNHTHIGNLNPERLYRSMRDSLIQRLEYCIDLHWKYINFHMKQVLNIYPETNSPLDVIRSATKATLLNEEDAEQALIMIQARNKTSHIYKEEIAEKFVASAKEYFDLISKVIKSLTPK